jgi:hypothetical protein
MLEKMLRKMQDEKHRVLIFTQMTRMLDILELFLTYHGMSYLRLDGATNVMDRQRLMDRYGRARRSWGVFPACLFSIVVLLTFLLTNISSQLPSTPFIFQLLLGLITTSGSSALSFRHAAVGLAST